MKNLSASKERNLEFRVFGPFWEFSSEVTALLHRSMPSGDGTEKCNRKE